MSQLSDANIRRVDGSPPSARYIRDEEAQRNGRATLASSAFAPQQPRIASDVMVFQSNPIGLVPIEIELLDRIFNKPGVIAAMQEYAEQIWLSEHLEGYQLFTAALTRYITANHPTASELSEIHAIFTTQTRSGPRPSQATYTEAMQQRIGNAVNQSRKTSISTAMSVPRNAREHIHMALMHTVEGLRSLDRAARDPDIDALPSADAIMRCDSFGCEKILDALRKIASKKEEPSAVSLLEMTMIDSAITLARAYHCDPTENVESSLDAYLDDEPWRRPSHSWVRKNKRARMTDPSVTDGSSVTYPPAPTGNPQDMQYFQSIPAANEVPVPQLPQQCAEEYCDSDSSVDSDTEMFSGKKPQ